MDLLSISNDAIAITLAKSQIMSASSSVVVSDVASKEGSIDVGVEPGMDEGIYTEDGTFPETGMAEMKDPLLSSWPFVIGISAAVLLVSVALGVFLAKRKIKKGIELYED